MKIPRKILQSAIKNDHASCISPKRGMVKRAKRLTAKRTRELVKKFDE